MAALCKKAMEQGTVIAIRFMGRYPPTARSVYKPPNSDDPHHDLSRHQHLLLQQQQHYDQFAFAAAGILSQPAHLCASGCSSMWGKSRCEGHDSFDFESLEAEFISGQLPAGVEDAILVIKAMVVAGEMAPAVYVLLLKLFLLEREEEASLMN